MVTGLTHKPVKITMTGPHMLARVAYDDFYNNLPMMMMDLAKLLQHNFRLLAATGCKNIQIDEPLFTMYDDEEVAAAVDAINSAIESLPHDIHVSVHVCQGIMRLVRNMTHKSDIDTSIPDDIKRTWFARSSARPIW